MTKPRRAMHRKLAVAKVLLALLPLALLAASDTALATAQLVAPSRSTWAHVGSALFILLLITALGRMHRSKLAREAAYSKRPEAQVRERTRELAAHADALEQANRRLEEASYTDPLTGLGNRRSLRHTVPQVIANMPR